MLKDDYAQPLTLYTCSAIYNLIMWSQDFRAIPQKENLDNVQNLSLAFCIHSVWSWIKYWRPENINLCKDNHFLHINLINFIWTGQRLGSTSDYKAGPGTYSKHGFLYSSLAGFKHVLETGNDEVKTKWHRRWAGKTSHVHLAPEHVFTTIHPRRTEWN